MFDVNIILACGVMSLVDVNQLMTSQNHKAVS
jgi:hypothetical protein